MSKKEHLQGIRAIAIISVLAFHFFPDYFPNGFLGVDQFFVLSGYLMCLILSNNYENKNQSIISKILDFYQRRLCRISPNYYFLILINISLLIFTSIFPVTFILTNQKSAKQSIFFMSNDFSNLEDDYYILLKIAENLFTHTWSLCVEIHFYFMIPIVFYSILKVFPDNDQKNYCLSILIVLSAISLCYYFISSRSIAFYSVFARIWQFLAGFLVYIWKQDKNNESEDEETQGIFSIVENKDTEVEANYENTQIWLLLITILMLFVGFEYPEKIVRIGMTLITALLILISENNNILSNKFMIYIGNISYSLYLIHWPIYCYSKFFNLNKLPFLVLSIFLGILIYETFEKWYTTKIEKKSQIILSTILFIFCVLAIWREDFRETYMNFTGQFDTIKNNALFGPVNSTNMTLDEIIKINRMYALKDEELLNYKECEYKTKELVPFGLCNVKNLSSTAPFKILIIGNSYAANLAPLIFKSCSKKSNLIWSASHPGCDYLCREYTWHQSCKTTLENPYETIEKMKFDYIFLISQCGGFCVNDEKSDKVDTVLNFAISQIAKIKDFVKHKIYIQTSVTVPSHMNYLDILLANHTSFDEIDKFFSTHLREPRKIGDLRNEKIAKFCGSKCEYFDPYANFQRNPYAPEIFRFFDDNGLAYVHSGGHFTPNAWSKIQPIFDEICDKI